MDQQKLRTLVFEKTGIKIDVDDPVFALVALNEAVLAEAVERHVALLDDATASLAEQAEALAAAGHLPEGAARAPRPVPALLKPAAAPGPAWGLETRMAALTGAGAVLCALLVLLGQALLFKPVAPPPSTVIAKELTPEQAQAIRSGEKLRTIVQKLDSKTRNAIEAEMQKP